MKEFKKIVYNKGLDEIEKIDKMRYILMYYLAYEVKIGVDSSTRLTFNQFSTGLRLIRRKNYATISASNIAQRIPSSSEIIYDFYNEIYTIKNDDLKENLLSLIYSYLDENNYFNDEIERLELTFKEESKNVICYSIYAQKFFFEESSKIEKISYNFFSDTLNTFMDITFDLLGIESSRLDVQMPKFFECEYDFVILFLPYKNTNLIARLSDNSANPSNSFEWNIIFDFMSKVKENATIVSFLSTGILNKVSDSKNRNRLLEEKYFNTIIELPHLQFMPTALTLIVFKKGSNKIKFINATKFAQNLRRGVNLDSERIIRAYEGKIEGALIIKKTSEIDELDNDLTAHHFFDETSQDFLNPTPLSKITTQIFRGYQIPSEMLDEYITKNETKIKLLTLSSIDDGMVIKNEIQSLKGIDKKMEHYIIESGDLVISCKGRTFKTAVIDVPYGETYISTGSLIVIRCNKDEVDPMYLKIFLDSELGKAALKRIQTGTNVLSLNPSKLLGVLIPLPHLSKQVIVSSSYRYKKKNLKEVKDVLSEMEEEIDKKFNKNFLSQIQ